jgi:hypothetical protein
VGGGGNERGVGGGYGGGGYEGGGMKDEGWDHGRQRGGARQRCVLHRLFASSFAATLAATLLIFMLRCLLPKSLPPARQNRSVNQPVLRCDVSNA